ncbi:MAG: alkaline phosphatase [Candidatus Doudnabacteria bacterium CG10_big_fil_rev_8_21_14_0_10_42_18]|uniref:Alkaline phosphatase n=1 Tax=Candidatus Doudnabacteria bacterium CG10_big_fil_rev_8_21_14_0_10_42_18 TaxID=1974552 RepID=A0A2H0VB06_9BACT|nr:MAG: alkaline phosphatase [Candidatus Doudnabacteria bacterium CG10_big_fil_rev_8_21_14_0_10_42_18]
MIESILAFLTNLVITTISSLGYPGIFFLMVLQSAAIPVPVEVIMPFSGFLASQGRFSFIAVVLAGTFGNLIGALVTYHIGKHGGRPLIEKYGRYILISKQDLEITERFFKKFGALAVFLGRMLPIVSTFISIPAGIARVRLSKFIPSTIMGAFIWNSILCLIGFKLGENWENLRSVFGKFDWLILILIVTGGIWWVWRHIVSRNQGARIRN